jgi:hypothetical protein
MKTLHISSDKRVKQIHLIFFVDGEQDALEKRKKNLFFFNSLIIDDISLQHVI